VHSIYFVYFGVLLDLLGYYVNTLYFISDYICFQYILPVLVLLSYHFGYFQNFNLKVSAFRSVFKGSLGGVPMPSRQLWHGMKFSL
jgi:hypothetical protein